MKNIILYSVLSLLILSGCIKHARFGEVPEIAFRSYFIGDTVDNVPQQIKYINLQISFGDGEGDIGLDNNEISPPYDSGGGYYYNFIASKYEFENGAYVYKSDEKARIPRLTEFAGKKGLQGLIDVKFFLYSKSGKRIRYDIFIYDRALHKSNVVSTPEIQLP